MLSHFLGGGGGGVGGGGSAPQPVVPTHKDKSGAPPVRSIREDLVTVASPLNAHRQVSTQTLGNEYRPAEKSSSYQPHDFVTGNRSFATAMILLEPGMPPETQL